MKDTMKNAMLLLVLAAFPLGFVSCGDDDDDVVTEFTDKAKPGTGTISPLIGQFEGKSNSWWLLTKVVHAIKHVENSGYNFSESSTIEYGYDADSHLTFIKTTDNGAGGEEHLWDFTSPNLVQTSVGDFPVNIGISYNASGYISRISQDISYPVYAYDEETSKDVLIGSGYNTATGEFTYDTDGHLIGVSLREKEKTFNEEGKAYIRTNESKYMLTWGESKLTAVDYEFKSKDQDGEQKESENWAADYITKSTPNPSLQWEGVNCLPFNQVEVSLFFFVNLLGKGSVAIPNGWYLTRLADEGENFSNRAVTVNGQMTKNSSELMAKSSSSSNGVSTFGTNTAFTYAMHGGYLKVPRRTSATIRVKAGQCPTGFFSHRVK